MLDFGGMYREPIIEAWRVTGTDPYPVWWAYVVFPVGKNHESFVNEVEELDIGLCYSTSPEGGWSLPGD